MNIKRDIKMEVLITESVPRKDLEEVTYEDMIRFAIEHGFVVTISSDEFFIRRGDERVFHQKFFGGKIAGVIDYLTAMSKATGLYRVDILRRLLSIKYKPSPESYHGYSRIKRGVIQRNRWKRTA